VIGFNLIWMFDRQDKLGRLVDELIALNLAGPDIGATFPFEQLPDALRTFQSGLTTGKVVVKV
jgi:synaptic vesicle membrane protein VAT-1